MVLSKIARSQPNQSSLLLESKKSLKFAFFLKIVTI